MRWLTTRLPGLERTTAAAGPSRPLPLDADEPVAERAGARPAEGRPGRHRHRWRVQPMAAGAGVGRATRGEQLPRHLDRARRGALAAAHHLEAHRARAGGADMEPERSVGRRLGGREEQEQPTTPAGRLDQTARLGRRQPDVGAGQVQPHRGEGAAAEQLERAPRQLPRLGRPHDEELLQPDPQRRQRRRIEGARAIHPGGEPQRPVGLGDGAEGEPGPARGRLSPELHHLTQREPASGQKTVDGGKAGPQHREQLAWRRLQRPDPVPEPLEHCRIRPRRRALHLAASWQDSIRPFSMHGPLTTPVLAGYTPGRCCPWPRCWSWPSYRSTAPSSGSPRPTGSTSRSESSGRPPPARGRAHRRAPRRAGPGIGSFDLQRPRRLAGRGPGRPDRRAGLRPRCPGLRPLGPAGRDVPPAGKSRPLCRSSRSCRTWMRWCAPCWPAPVRGRSPCLAGPPEDCGPASTPRSGPSASDTSSC